MAHTPWPDLAELQALLVSEDMAHGPEVWFNIHQLLLILTAQGECPSTAEEFANVIGPLVCKNPQHQQRLLALIKVWLNVNNSAPQAQVSQPTRTAQPTRHWQTRLRHSVRQYVLEVLCLLVLLALAVFAYSHQPQQVSPPTPVSEITPATPSKPGQPPPLTPNIAISDWVAPNPQPMPIKPVVLASAKAAWLSLPSVLLLLWLGWRYRRRRVMRTHAADDEYKILGLQFNNTAPNISAAFTGPDIARAAQQLLRPKWLASSRLHVADTVTATAQAFGLFTPVYQQRPIQPEYLVLVQSLHSQDQLADLAETLIAALSTRQLRISSYRFRDDPRLLIPWRLADGATAAHSLSELALNQATARLIIISDWGILFHPYQHQRPRAWVGELDTWLQRVWLSPGYDTPQAAQLAQTQAQDLNLHLLPLTAAHIPQLAEWLSQDLPLPAATGQTDDGFILPPIFSDTAESWLEWRPPHGIRLNDLSTQLRAYLGAEGFLLLQASAVFPKPLWALVQLLDSQLFPSQQAVPKQSASRRMFWLKKPSPVVTTPPNLAKQRLAREQRLLRLSRLPWLRHAYMPDYLRLHWLKALSRHQRHSLSQLWRGLLSQLQASSGNKRIDLPIAMSKHSRWYWQHWLTAQSPHNSFNDPIFANIVLGGKLGLLDFRVPMPIAKLLPDTVQWLDVRLPLTAILLAIASTVCFNWAWQETGQQLVPQLYRQWQAQENARWQVQLAYPDARAALADSLASQLQAEKFTTTQTVNPRLNSQQNSRIHYALGGETAAQRVAEQLAWLSYNAPVDVIASSDLAAHQLQVELSQSYQPNSGFNDVLRYGYKKTSLKTDSLPLEPDMVVIKPGSFMMGSKVTEAKRGNDEGPQHKVTIDYPFAIAKYEVTFAEYDRFALATRRTLPDDEGWGRKNRPVINVSYDDAIAYTRWLSQQTGKNYRLPSEAEWEYVARAGSQTAYWWGDKVGNNHAVCDGCGSPWDNKQTAPVGAFKANRFGVYDTAGNVWEWTQDCWHDSYNNAPIDGSAWLAAKGGECDRRVVRGGSWDNIPQDLRSADPDRIDSDAAYSFLGFRVARAL